jgi:hypothetical protein
MRLDYALEALKLRFTADRVIEETGRVILKLEYLGQPALVFVSLTVEQAKVLVVHPISAKELVDENYPPGWPKSLPSRSTFARPSHRAAEPVRFCLPREGWPNAVQFAWRNCHRGRACMSLDTERHLPSRRAPNSREAVTTAAYGDHTDVTRIVFRRV